MEPEGEEVVGGWTLDLLPRWLGKTTKVPSLLAWNSKDQEDIREGLEVGVAAAVYTL